MPPHTTKNSLRDCEDSATPTPDPQEPTLSAHIHEVTEEIPDDPTEDQPAPNLAEAILLMTNELCRRETPSKPINMKGPLNGGQTLTKGRQTLTKTHAEQKWIDI